MTTSRASPTSQGKKSAQTLTSNFGKLAAGIGAELVGTDGFDQSIALVLEGRADATINDSLSFFDFKKQQPDANVKIVATAGQCRLSPACIIRKGEPELLAAINEALAEIKADGTYADDLREVLRRRTSRSRHSVPTSAMTATDRPRIGRSFVVRQLRSDRTARCRTGSP